MSESLFFADVRIFFIRPRFNQKKKKITSRFNLGPDLKQPNDGPWFTSGWIFLYFYIRPLE
jgi:hypothetical protein